MYSEWQNGSRFAAGAADAACALCIGNERDASRAGRHRLPLKKRSAFEARSLYHQLYHNCFEFLLFLHMQFLHFILLKYSSSAAIFCVSLSLFLPTPPAGGAFAAARCRFSNPKPVYSHYMVHFVKICIRRRSPVFLSIFHGFALAMIDFYSTVLYYGIARYS